MTFTKTEAPGPSVAVVRTENGHRKYLHRTAPGKDEWILSLFPTHVDHEGDKLRFQGLGGLLPWAEAVEAWFGSWGLAEFEDVTPAIQVGDTVVFVDPEIPWGMWGIRRENQTPGTVTEVNSREVYVRWADQTPSSTPRISYRHQLYKVTPNPKTEEKNVTTTEYEFVGPQTKVQVSYPFGAEGSLLKDANGNTLADFDAENLDWTQDKELAELAAKLLNEYFEKRDATGGGLPFAPGGN